MESGKRVVFSGIQPTGQVHLGNYLGAIKQWVARLEERDNIFCIVDLHALTIYQDPADLARSVRQVVALLIAAGLDPNKCLLYVQSHVAAHAELAWLLTCVTPIGWLTRMTQFRAKSKGETSVGTGLLCYPVLQAADVLLFQTDVVPTGDDQRAHIELARDIGGRFNNLYGELFKLPESEVPEVGARIAGLDDPTEKMSKSLMKDRPMHGIALLDSVDSIVSKLKVAKTDSGKEIGFSDDPQRAGVNNLLTIYQACTGKSPADVLADFSSARGYGDLKKAVAEVVVETLRPIQATYEKIYEDTSYLDDVIRTSADRASNRCASVLEAAYERMGVPRLS